MAMSTRVDAGPLSLEWSWREKDLHAILEGENVTLWEGITKIFSGPIIDLSGRHPRIVEKMMEDGVVKFTPKEKKTVDISKMPPVNSIFYVSFSSGFLCGKPMLDENGEENGLIYWHLRNDVRYAFPFSSFEQADKKAKIFMEEEKVEQFRPGRYYYAILCPAIGV